MELNAGGLQLGRQGFAFVLGARERGAELADAAGGGFACGLFQAQGLREHAQFGIELGQGAVAPAHRIGKHELTDDEDQDHEHQHHQQRGEGVDEARPEIQPPAARQTCHGSLRPVGAAAAQRGGDGARQQAQLGAQVLGELRALGGLLGELA